VTRRDGDAEAAAAIRQCRAELAARGGSIVREATGGAAAVADWQHYPPDDAYDPTTHLQYFFHRHAAAAGPPPQLPGECGHFHLFLRGEGIPAGISPLVFADSAVAVAPPLVSPSAPLRRGRRAEVCHLIAIAVDGGGEPIGLFTTNRWVTGETWYRADDVVRLIAQLRFDPLQPAPLLDRWITAVVRLFATDIAGLVARRDRLILDWRWRWPRRNALEDPQLEITSHAAIDLDARLAAAEAGTRAAAPPPAALRRGSLAAAANGWGR
jgi:hypothetical protein